MYLKQPAGASVDVCPAADGPVKTLLSVSAELPASSAELARDIAFHLTQSGRLRRHTERLRLESWK